MCSVWSKVVTARHGGTIRESVSIDRRDNFSQVFFKCDSVESENYSKFKWEPRSFEFSC